MHDSASHVKSKTNTYMESLDIDELKIVIKMPISY